MNTDTGPALSGRCGAAFGIVGSGAAMAGRSVTVMPASGVLLASFANVQVSSATLIACACEIIGARLSANRLGWAIATGVTSPRETMTRAPIVVAVHIWRANASGMRMQPCEAG